MVARPMGTEPAVSDGLNPSLPDLYNGYVITDGSTYGPQMPWYMSHYCDSMFPGSDVQDPVCYADYFSPMNSGFNAANGNGLADKWPRSVPWSVYPTALAPPAPGNHCAWGVTKCTMVLATFPFTALQSNPNLLQAPQYNNFLLTWFNNALGNFPADVGPLDLQHHFPWNGQPVSWETFLYPQGAQNPFLGQYLTTPPQTSSPSPCTMDVNGTGNPLCANTGNVMASLYLYPRQCTLGDLASGNVSRLRQCSLNYELHHNGYLSQWTPDYWQEFADAGMRANQYGRTSFLFAGVPGMQMPVSFYKDPMSGSGLNIYGRFTTRASSACILPIANVADVKACTFHGRNYTDKEFYHTLLMTNHMESDPAQFAEGIRGKTLWHNEYRTQRMYESLRALHRRTNFLPCSSPRHSTPTIGARAVPQQHLRRLPRAQRQRRADQHGRHARQGAQEFMTQTTYTPYDGQGLHLHRGDPAHEARVLRPEARYDAAWMRRATPSRSSFAAGRAQQAAADAGADGPLLQQRDHEFLR